ERAPFATIKACVNANSPSIQPLEISVSSVPTLIRWTHFINGPRPRYAVEIATVEVSAGQSRRLQRLRSGEVRKVDVALSDQCRSLMPAFQNKGRLSFPRT